MDSTAKTAPTRAEMERALAALLLQNVANPVLVANIAQACPARIFRDPHLRALAEAIYEDNGKTGGKALQRLQETASDELERAIALTAASPDIPTDCAHGIVSALLGVTPVAPGDVVALEICGDIIIGWVRRTTPDGCLIVSLADAYVSPGGVSQTEGEFFSMECLCKYGLRVLLSGADERTIAASAYKWMHGSPAADWRCGDCICFDGGVCRHDPPPVGGRQPQVSEDNFCGVFETHPEAPGKARPRPTGRKTTPAVTADGQPMDRRKADTEAGQAGHSPAIRTDAQGRGKTLTEVCHG